jgi:uncharacterized membrane protein
VRVLLGNGPWMVWNLLLAAIAPALAWMLFARRRWNRSPFWWIGAAAFVVFLPNAPYVLTDLMHLPYDALVVHGHAALTAALLIQYTVFVVVGVACYAGSIELLRRCLRRSSWSGRSVFGVELSLHALCAVGVLLGRYARFNSWDLGVRPGAVVTHLGSRLDRPFSWMLLVSTFGILVAATFVARVVASGFASVWRRPPPFLRS